jgi:magnesium transporter
MNLLPKLLRPAKKPGLPPGSLVFTGEKKTESVDISIFSYDEQEVVEQRFDTIDECLAAVKPGKRNWINIDGLHDTAFVEKVGHHFHLHPLLLEDVVHTSQRPKVEGYDEDRIVFLVGRMSYLDANDEIDSEQVSFILGKDFLVTLQERPGDVFEPVRERLRTKRPRMLAQGCDYLVYALLDAIVDHDFVLLERYSDAVERIEESILREPTQDDLRAIHKLKQGLISLRKATSPLREVLTKIERGEFHAFGKYTMVYFRDLYDHTIRVIEAVEAHRDVLASLQDMYMTFQSNKMNQVMKVLTIIATIFIPLTFLAGVYGMNFHNMPELSWRYSYFVVLGVMALIAIIMLIIFRVKRWL